MSTTTQETCRSVARLADALTRLGDALARPDLAGVLQTEPLLEELTRALAQASATPEDRAALLPLLVDARLALRRAAILGESLMFAAAATSHAAGVAHGYARDGRGGHPDAAPALEARG
jgi:hypothetical protein